MVMRSPDYYEADPSTHEPHGLCRRCAGGLHRYTGNPWEHVNMTLQRDGRRCDFDRSQLVVTCCMWHADEEEERDGTGQDWVRCPVCGGRNPGYHARCASTGYEGL